MVKMICCHELISLGQNVIVKFKPIDIENSDHNLPLCGSSFNFGTW